MPYGRHFLIAFAACALRVHNRRHMFDARNYRAAQTQADRRQVASELARVTVYTIDQIDDLLRWGWHRDDVRKILALGMQYNVPIRTVEQWCAMADIRPRPWPQLDDIEVDL